MISYEIIFARSARKEFEDWESKIVTRIFTKIENLQNEPRPHGCKKLVGEKDLWRIKAGDYRVVYSIDDEGRVVDVIAIRHRRDVYR